MALRFRPLEAVHHRGLGHAERKPFLYLMLKRELELGDELFLFCRNILFSSELDLEGEFADQR